MNKQTYNDILKKYGYAPDTDEKTDAGTVDRILAKYGYASGQPEEVKSGSYGVSGSWEEPSLLQKTGQIAGDVLKGLELAIPAGMGETAASGAKAVELASELTGGDKWLRPWWSKYIPESVIKPVENLMIRGGKFISRFLPEKGREIPASDIIGEGISDTAYQMVAPLEEEAGKLSVPGRFAYQIGKPVANILMTGGLGQALATGLQSAAAKAIIELTPFALSAAGSYAKEAELLGATPLQQAAYGTIMGIAEGASEKIPFDVWFKAIGGKSGVMSWIKSMGIEGLQELIMDPVSALAKKGLRIGDIPWTGEGGVLDPGQMVKSFAGGVGTGLLMKGGTAAAGRVLNLMERQRARKSRQTKPTVQPFQQEAPVMYPFNQLVQEQQPASAYTGPERRVDLETRQKVDNGEVTPEQLAELRRKKEFLEKRKSQREQEVKPLPTLEETVKRQVEIDLKKASDLSKIKPGDIIYDTAGRQWEVVNADQSGFRVKSPSGAETFLGKNKVRLTKPEGAAQAQIVPEKPVNLKQKQEQAKQIITGASGKMVTQKAAVNEGEPKVSFRAIRKGGSFIVTEWIDGKKGTTYTVPAEEYLQKSNYEKAKYIESIHKTRYEGFEQDNHPLYARVRDAFGWAIDNANKLFEQSNVVIDNPPPGGWKESDKVPEKYKPKPKSDIIKSEGDLDVESGNSESKQILAQPVRGHVPGARKEIPAQHVSRDEGVRDVIKTGISSAGAGEGSKGGVGGARIESGPGGGDRTPRLHPAQARKEPGELVNRNNYRITSADRIGTGTEGERLRSNLEAIKIVKRIMAENRSATREEQAALVKYVGWGGLPNVFNERVTDGQMAKAREELKQLLTPDEYRAASASVKNAHYTSEEVVRAMWEGIKHLGFTKGYVLEPAAGVGHFIGLMPEKIAQGSRVTGIELDTITGNIAKYLYPNSDIRVMGFEKTDLSPIYDLAVSNVPFGDYAVYDEKIPKPMRSSIHNYFFAKALETVRPGGLIVFITSRYTMDARPYKQDDFNPRKYIANRANFIGAIRLPNTAFKSSSGTEVVTDIIVLQRKGEGVRESSESWLNVKKMDDSDYYSPYTNEYFHNHPEMVLGKEALTGSMYGAKEYTVEPNGEPLGPQIEKAFKSMPKVFKPKEATNITNPKPVEMIAAPGELKEGSFTIQDGKLYRNRKGVLSEETATPAEIKRIGKQIELVELIKENMRIQYSGGTDAALKESQAKLNKAYDSFVKEYGYLHEKKNSGKFADDPEFNRLLAVENWDPKTKKAAKSDIFTKRTIQQYTPPTSADNAHEALIYSLNEKGVVDLDYMAELTGQSSEKVIADLGNAVYQNPDSSVWETADAYLSGNVRAKLKIAQNYAKLNPKYKRNVEALEKVIPKDLVPAEIKVRLGAVWIPPEIYTDFVRSIFGSGVEISYSSALGEWMVGKGYRSSLATNEYGTIEKDFYELLHLAMNNRKPEVYDRIEVDGVETRVLNQQKTLAAVAKQEKIQKAFEDWIWKDKDRAEKLARIYNDTNNNIALRSWDGAHMTFPGMNPVWAKKLKPHQKNAIWRGVQGGNALLAHCVGAGKTAEQVAIAMELKRLGIVRKMVWAVPKPLIQQAANDALDIYPGAKILVAGEKSFGKDERREFMNKIATGDWDLIIISHSNLTSIPVSEQAIRDFYNERIFALRDAVNEEIELGIRSNRGLVKKLEKMIANLQAKLAEEIAGIKKRQDVGNITWEETGIDGLMVDEAHHFKNLFYHTKMDKVAGLGSQQGNQKTTDLYMKVRYLQKLNGGRGVIFATGTPVANSIAELYHMQRYLQPNLLEERKIPSFDAWVNNFAQVSPELEMKPAGDGYRLKDRLSSFVNLPELQQIFRSFADIQTPDMLKLPVPEVATGKPEEIAAEPRKELLDYIQTLAARAKALKGTPEKGGDNMLKISGDGRKASLDMRLINPTLPDDPNSKVNLTVEKIVEHYKETAKYNGTQAVFLDLSTPGKTAAKTLKERQIAIEDDIAEESGLSELSEDEKALKAQDSAEAIMIYQDIKNKLIAKGIPANEIAFIHDAKTKEARQKMFEEVNSGKIRVILGSTAKLGTGANIQERLFAIYNLDAPWKPAEVEQRIGRILRQGNKHMEWGVPIHIYNVITKRSFDARTWNLLNQKQRFIDQLMSPDMTTRQIGDPGGDAVLNFAEVAAIASDNPDILRDIELDNIVAKYRAMKADYERSLREMRLKQSYLPEMIANAKESIAKYQDFISKRQDTTGDNFSITLGKQTINKRDEADEYIKKLAGERYEGKLGTFAGLPIEMAIGEKGPYIIAGGLVHSDASISSLEHRIRRSPEATITDLEERVRKYEKELSDTQQLIDKPFEYETELREAEAESKEIKARLLKTEDPIQEAVQEIDQAIAETGEGFKTAEATKIAAGSFEAINRVKRAIDVLFGRDDNQVQATDAAVERVLTATKSPLNIKSQIKESYQGIGRAFKDLFVYEWTVQEFPGFQNDLRLFKGVARDAQKFALDMTLKVLKPLQTPREFEIFRRLVFLRDLEQGVKEAEPDAAGVARNIGLSEDQIKKAQKELWALAAKMKGSDARIKMALWAHDKVYRAMWEDLKLRGKVSPEAQGREHYVPHRVLDYMNDVDRRFPALGKRFKTPYRYYLKGRTGSQRLIDTDYIGITLRHFAKLFMDNATDDFNIRIATKFDQYRKLTKKEKSALFGKKKVPVPGKLYEYKEKRYIGWQYDPGRQMYPVVTAAGKTVPALGRYKKTYLLPVEIADRLTHFKDVELNSHVLNALRKANSIYKQMLFSPVTLGVPFQMNNFIGDLIKLYAADAEAVKYLVKGWQAAKQWQKGQVDKDLEELVRMAEQSRVMESTFMREAGMPYDPKLAQLQPRRYLLRKFNPFVAWSDVSERRELTPRLAKMYADLKRINNGEMPRSTVIDVEALNKNGMNTREIAGKLAREVTVDYHKMNSETQRVLRDILFPFFAFYYGNFPDWFKYAKRSPLNMAVKVLLPVLIMTMWNWMKFRDTEEKLPAYYRVMPHIITGWRDKEGKPIIIAMQTPVDLAAKMIGLDKTIDIARKVQAGELSWDEGIKELGESVLFAPWESFKDLLTPFIKAPIEAAMNKSWFNERKIVPERLIGTKRELPLRIKYVVEQWVSPVGNWSRQQEGDIIESAKKYFTRGPGDIPRAVGIRHVDLGREQLNRFYDRLTKLEADYKAFQTARRQGRKTTFTDFGQYRLFSKTAKDFSMINQRINRIKDSGLSSDEKNKSIKTLQQQMYNRARVLLSRSK